MPILQIQKRARELGRIRIGQKGDRGEPQKLDRFRITSNSQPLVEKVAQLYGGQARPWDNGGVQQWEVITDARRIPIMVPPQPVSQWLETWAGGSKGCVHRCDGETNFLTGEPCDPDDPDHLNAKPTTRLNVVLRDVEGIGVFRLESHGWNAAIELPDVAGFLAQAGGYVNGWLALEERTSKSEGQTRRFVVPIIEIDVTPAQLMAGHGRVGTPELESGSKPAVTSGDRPALGAGVTEDVTVEYRRFLALVEAAQTSGEVMALFEDARAAGLIGSTSKPHELREPLFEAIKARGTALSGQQGEKPTEEPVDAVVVDEPTTEADPDVVWQQILATAGDLGADLGTVTRDFEQRMALAPGEASAGELQTYLQLLRTEGLDQAVPA